jgi:hypothetical protein
MSHELIHLLMSSRQKSELVGTNRKETANHQSETGAMQALQSRYCRLHTATSHSSFEVLRLLHLVILGSRRTFIVKINVHMCLPGRTGTSHLRRTVGQRSKVPITGHLPDAVLLSRARYRTPRVSYFLFHALLLLISNRETEPP